MAYTVDILNKLNVEGNGLLSKIQIGGKTYEIKDLIARQNIGTLSAGLDAIAADLAALSYIKNTGVYADDAAIKAALEAGDKAVKDYVDAQVGAINKFDVHVMAEGEALPTASAETMYVLYLKPDTDSASGAYVEYITIRSGEEDAYVYEWEAIGSTKMDVTGFVTETALNETLKDYKTNAAAKEEHDALVEAYEAADQEIIDSLGTLAYKDSASGAVTGQTISGVKANGQSAGSITVELEATEKATSAAGKFTPAGNVTGTVQTAGSISVTAKHEAAEATLTKGDYTPAGTVTANFNHSATNATLTKGDYTPAGTVKVALTGAEFNAITSVGTAAQFTEGEFTPATLNYAAADYSVAKEGIVGSVDGECLTFTTAGLEAISASKINSFNGGSKAADTFVANTPATMAAQTVGVQSAAFTGTKAEQLVVTGVSYDKASLSDLAFAGTKAEGALVTGVSYDKADIDTATFTGETVDIAATFAGTEGDVAVAGKCKDYAVKTAQFNPAAIELSVGDIVVTEKNVTVQ